MKTLIDTLESTCSQSQQLRDTFARLKGEMDAARENLKNINTQ